VENRNINQEMVEGGWAWQYRKYDRSKALADAEACARSAKRGLWADAHPVAPWEWRAAQRSLKAPTAQAPTDRATEAGYWLNASSSVRHNSKCQYCRKTKGRECGPNEGRACKICGG
jgi:micrococcal nuclease